MFEASHQEMSTLARAIRYAAEHPEDGSLAIYMLRDLPLTRKMELSDLAWAYHRDNNVWPSEVVDFLESYVSKLNAQALLLLINITREQAVSQTAERIERQLAERKRDQP